MFQEAHLDHRIQLNFNSKDSDEDDEETAADGQPSAGVPSRQRPDRGGRGRRGRGAPAPSPQGNRRGRSDIFHGQVERFAGRRKSERRQQYDLAAG